MWAYYIFFSNFLDPLNLPNCPTLFSLSLSVNKIPQAKNWKMNNNKKLTKRGKLPNQTHSEMWGHALECGWYSTQIFFLCKQMLIGYSFLVRGETLYSLSPPSTGIPFAWACAGLMCIVTVCLCARMSVLFFLEDPASFVTPTTL